MEDEFTYLMSDGLYYKIGKSKNPEKRLRGLSTGNANCKLLFYGKGRTEKQLHEIFAAFRVKGEWYRLSGKHIALIGRLLLDRETGDDLRECSKLRSAYKREKEAHGYVIGFGKYKGRTVESMQSKDEVKYLLWVKTWPHIDKSNPALLRAINFYLHDFVLPEGWR